MKIRPFLDRLFHTPIARLVIVTLIAVAWSIPALCGEINRAAINGDLEKIETLLKANPKLVFSNEGFEGTPFQLQQNEFRMGSPWRFSDCISPCNGSRPD
jgi:hypothetical protein